VATQPVAIWPVLPGEGKDHMKILNYISASVICSYLFHPGYSQTGPPVRYKDPVFQTVKEEKNLSYFSDSPARQNKSYRFDLYQPEPDSVAARPLIIWMHGGGFKFGSKRSKSIRLWSKAFASTGYVCAAINYRLSKKNPLFNFRELVKSCSDAVVDVQRAVGFFKKNYVLYRIDTSRIVLAGNSAGGIIALQAAYSSGAELLQLQRRPDSNLITGPYNPGNIGAVVNFWGAIFDLEWLKNGRVPIVSVHGNKDKIVPIDHKGSSFYGSLAIHARADSLHIPNRLKVYEGYSHELQKHFNPFFTGRATRQRWQEAGRFAADFLYEELFLTPGSHL